MAGTARPAKRAVFIRAAWFALAAVLTAVLLAMCILPDNIVLSETRSPDGRWIALVEESVFKSSVATPVKSIQVQRRYGILVSPLKTSILTFNQDDESQPVRLKWQSASSLQVELPPSANGFAHRLERLDDLQITYTFK
jgi:hypothetical protein